MPAIAAVQARDLQSRSGNNARPCSYQASGPGRFEADEGQHAVVRIAQVGTHSEPLAVLGGQVDPAHLVAVLDDVAEDVGDLQGNPQRVGERFRSIRVAGPVDPEAEAPDAAGHPVAVADQLVEAGVARAVHVHFAPVDQVVQGGHGDRKAAGDVRQCGQDRIVLGARCHDSRGGEILRRARAASFSGPDASPSPMSSIRRAMAYKADMACRLATGRSRIHRKSCGPRCE